MDRFDDNDVEDDGDLSAADVTALLDATPGLSERVDRALAQARNGETIPLDDL